MASKPETTFTNGVHDHLPPGFYRMKTHNPYIGGPADMWYSGRSTDLWVEYKFEVLPKRPETLITPGCSKLQLDWLGDRYDEGRDVIVIVGCGKGREAGGVVYENKTWEEPMSRAEFEKRIVSRKDLAAFILKRTGGPR